LQKLMHILHQTGLPWFTYPYSPGNVAEERAAFRRRQGGRDAPEKWA
jgi:hypothetical protein